MSMLQLPALGTAATANDASLASPLATLRMSGEPGTPAALDGALPELTAATVNASDTAPTFDTALAGLGGPTAPAPAPVRDVAPAPAPLALPADPDAGFDDGFGARIAWMADQRLGQAQIRLNPEHLGPIEVSLQLDGSRVDAQFHSTHVEVRAALEASVPRLRELLGQHGLQLGQADVGQRQSAWTPAGQAAAPMQGGGEAGESVPSTAEVITHRRGLLDEYA
jgi:flagellar hook-length control protein FliK